MRWRNDLKGAHVAVARTEESGACPALSNGNKINQSFLVQVCLPDPSRLVQKMHKYTTELRILLQIVRIQIWLKYFSKSDPDSTYQNLTTCKQKKLHFFFKHIKNLIFKIKHKQHVMSFEVFLHQCLNNFLMLLCKLRVESARLVYPSFILMVCLSSLNADCNLMN